MLDLLDWNLLVDSHLHVWGDGTPPYPYAAGKEPPERLRESSSAERLIGEMDNAGIGGALIVQVCDTFGVHSIELSKVQQPGNNRAPGTDEQTGLLGMFCIHPGGSDR